MNYLILITIFSILLVVLFIVASRKKSMGDEDGEDMEEPGQAGGTASMR
jgi:preprotein translocase subunit SecG